MGGVQRSFVHFILEPLYKIHSQVLGEDPFELDDVLGEIGVKLNKKEKSANAKPLLKMVMQRWLGAATGFVDMCAEFIPSPVAAARTKTMHTYMGDMNGKIFDDMATCNPDGELMVQVTKLYNTADASAFHTFGRVMSGTLRPGEKVILWMMTRTWPSRMWVASGSLRADTTWKLP